MKNTILTQNVIAGASCMLVSAASVIAFASRDALPVALLFLVSFAFGIYFFSASVKQNKTTDEQTPNTSNS